MIAHRLAVFLAALLLPVWVVAQDNPKPEATDAKADAVQDMVFFGDKRPVLLRFHIEIEGKPLRAAWREFMADYFKYLDRDSDGVLNKAEAEAIQQPQQLFSGPFGGGRAGAVNFRRLDTKKTDGKVTLEELSEFFLENGGGPFQEQGGDTGSGGAARALNEALFTRLDADKDGNLSLAELKTAADSLLKLDVNEDELITQAELGPNPYQGGAAGQVQVFAPPLEDMSEREGASFLAVELGDGGPVARELQNRYGKGVVLRDRKLRAENLGLDADTFALVDRNKDGTLDAGELQRFTDRPADVDLRVRLGRVGSGTAALEVITPSPPAPLPQGGEGRIGASLASSVRQLDHGLLVVDIDNARLELRRGDAGGLVAQINVAEFYKQQFKAADADNNNYLDATEAQRNRQFQFVFKQMDKDGDGMLFEKEMLEYVKGVEALQAKASACRASVNVSEGQGMFELLDANRDGRLTTRELKDAPKLVAQLDRAGDGAIAKLEVPRSFQLAFSRGQAGVIGGRVRVPRLAAPMDRPMAPPAAGPLWFRKMDRNRDGDVSRREFLGAGEDFDRLDADHDGLISPEEAEKAKEGGTP